MGAREWRVWTGSPLVIVHLHQHRVHLGALCPLRPRPAKVGLPDGLVADGVDGVTAVAAVERTHGESPLPESAHHGPELGDALGRLGVLPAPREGWPTVAEALTGDRDKQEEQAEHGEEGNLSFLQE